MPSKAWISRHFPAKFSACSGPTDVANPQPLTAYLVIRKYHPEISPLIQQEGWDMRLRGMCYGTSMNFPRRVSAYLC